MNRTSSRRNKYSRAFSLAELLTVIVIFGLLSTLGTLVIAPLMSQPNRQQAKVDTIQAATRTMYRIERDLRMTSPSAVYACTYPAPSTCTSPSVMTSTAVLVIATPRVNGNGQPKWDPTNGQPVWQGFNVYWLAADPNDATKTNLMFKYTTATIQPGTFTGADNSSVNTAISATDAELLATGVTDLQTYMDSTNSIVGFKFKAQATDGGHTNETTLQSNVNTRN
ncbi:MAG TPA: prepilin-type N-terminal cleavage/methylation domain-containing protein [Candidatus Tumulicola sp.]|nr:prepilin-type N-terminal cleavage/methylation domain-containing protein [Candidatus Tumulicola sp.]